MSHTTGLGTDIILAIGVIYIIFIFLNGSKQDKKRKKQK